MSGSSTNTLGKYQIVREIARSNDIVYEAIDPSLNRRVALKELSIPPNLTGAQKRERVERFLREGRAAGKLAHPNIVTIYDVGKENDRYYIAMEYLEGQTLRDCLQAGGALSIRDATNYALQLCSALAYAHQNGVIHRDIKPDNVQILPGGHIKLTDFGIARLMGESSITQDGQVFGTPSYMSPEQVAGKSLDTRSDIFSLGVVLYEMVAGKKPFAGDSVVTITYNIVNMEAPPPPGAPPYLVGIIRKAMAKDANARYSTVDEMADDLREERSSGGMPLTGPIIGTWPPQGPIGQPGPFQPPASQQPVPPLTPYGTSWPSAGAGAQPGSAPDPFAPMGHTPAQIHVPTPPPSPPAPVMSSETKNFVGIFLLTIAFTGMLVFAVWAVRLAFTGYMTSTTSGAAEQLYQQAEQAFKNGDSDGAVQLWLQAVEASPDSTAAENSRNRIYEVSVERARVSYQAGDYALLEIHANSLMTAKPKRPEGYYYMAIRRDAQGEMTAAKENYQLAIQYGGNDAYAQAARDRLGSIYLQEGDTLSASGQAKEALEAYQNAKQYGNTDVIQQADQRIANLNYHAPR